MMFYRWCVNQQMWQSAAISANIHPRLFCFIMSKYIMKTTIINGIHDHHAIWGVCLCVFLVFPIYHIFSKFVKMHDWCDRKHNLFYITHHNLFCHRNKQESRAISILTQRSMHSSKVLIDIWLVLVWRISYSRVPYSLYIF